MSNGDEHPAAVATQLVRLYGEAHRSHACRADSAEAFSRWQAVARPELRRLLGLDRIAAQAGVHQPTVTWAEGSEDLGFCQRRRGWIETEPGVRTAFWMLEPPGDGPFPLVVTPHGHENGNVYAGLSASEGERAQIDEADADVAVQAARRGCLAIAPATRGLSGNPDSYGIADIDRRHGGRDCVCHNWQVAIVGRTALGERVWDLSRILDWAQQLPQVTGPTLMLGNSGGGMATLHTAACDQRIDVAVPCCAYNNYLSPRGTLRHCPCNAVPGLLSFGEFWDVAGLVAPRPLLTVNGRHDRLHPTDEVDVAVERLRHIYAAGGAPGGYEHRYGAAGHRFYADLMWPWIEAQMAAVAPLQAG
jgi:hypothetical protein